MNCYDSLESFHVDNSLYKCHSFKSEFDHHLDSNDLYSAALCSSRYKIFRKKENLRVCWNSGKIHLVHSWQLRFQNILYNWIQKRRSLWLLKKRMRENHSWWATYDEISQELQVTKLRLLTSALSKFSSFIWRNELLLMLLNVDTTLTWVMTKYRQKNETRQTLKTLIKSILIKLDVSV